MIITIKKNITIPPMIRVSVVELNSMEGLVMEGRYVVRMGRVKWWPVTIFDEELLTIAVLIAAVDSIKKKSFLKSVEKAAVIPKKAIYTDCFIIQTVEITCIWTSKNFTF